MGYRPIGVPSGICSGMTSLPAFLHQKIGPIPLVVATKNISCAWMPISTIPIVPIKGKVLIEKQPPLVQGDVLIPTQQLAQTSLKSPVRVVYVLFRSDVPNLRLRTL